MKDSTHIQLIPGISGSVAGYNRNPGQSQEPFIVKHRYNTRMYSVRSVTASPDGNYLVITNTSNPKIKVLDLERLEYSPHPYTGHQDTVRLISFAPDGLSFFTASWDCTVRQFEFYTGRCLKVFSGFGKSPSVFMDPAGKFVFNASYDSYIDITKTNTGRCIDISTKKVINSYPHGHSMKNSESIDIAYDQEYCYTGSQDAAAYKWQLLGKMPVMQYFKEEGAGVRKIAVTEKYFAAACTDGRIRLFQKRTGECVNYFVHTAGSEALDVKISQDETKLYSCASDGTLKCFDLLTFKTIFHRKAHRNWIWGICLMDKDRLVVSGSTDGTIAFSDRTGKLQARLFNLVEDDILVTCPPEKVTYPNGFFYTSNKKLIEVYKVHGKDRKKEVLGPGSKKQIDEYIDPLNQKNLIITRLRNETIYKRMMDNYRMRKNKIQGGWDYELPRLLTS